MSLVILKHRLLRWGRRVWARFHMPHPFAHLHLRYRKWQVNRSLRVLDALDWHMTKAGWNRHERRRFWREFIKKQEVRTEVFNKLTQQ